LVDYIKGLNKLSGTSLGNVSTVAAIVSASTETILGDINSFIMSVEEIHKYANDAVYIENLVNWAHDLRAHVIAINSLFRSLDNLAQRTKGSLSINNVSLLLQQNKIISRHVGDKINRLVTVRSDISNILNKLNE
jgi:hypothetical protein